ncbi:MAG: hypothetical protein OEV25_14785, partial [Deltaproteobacteria bacterium]|nr:hypothetical protein [Deltaproteobacteria bacterium]
MSKWQAFFDKINTLIHQVTVGNELWRFIASLGVLVIGFLILETLWRSANRQIKASVEKKGLDPEVWNLSLLLPPLRLAFAALLLRLAEVFLVLPGQLRQILHGLETLILALAIILLLFQVVGLLDRLRGALPAAAQDALPEET